MLASTTSKHVKCDIGARRNAFAVARPERCTLSTTLGKSTIMPSPVQHVVLMRSAAESAAAVTTTAPPAADPATTAPQLQELTKDTFQSFLDAAGDKLVVVDFFTDWCGPCKLIYPQLVALSAELEPAATIVKFNCNQHNKELAKALGIKVAPTFHIYKNGQKVADMTGAKVDKLRALIDDQLKAGEGQN